MRRISSILTVALLLSVCMPQRLDALTTTQDTDGDGLPDLQEDANGNGKVDAGETDPYKADTDGGGESDGTEVHASRNPLDPTDDMTADADGDGWVNGIEIVNGTDPKKADTDGDGINDPQDPFPTDSKHAVDANRNGLPDDWEKATKLDQQPIPQSKVDDPDADGLNNAQELAIGTNPLSVDSDRDGIDDLTEKQNGGNPRESACLSYEATGDRFSDISGHWSEPFVTVLHDTMILPDTVRLVGGYQRSEKNGIKTIFAPDQPVTRYEFLKMTMLSVCTHLVSTTEREKPFTDITNIARINENADASLKRKVVYTAEHYGIIGGYADGTFGANAPVNRAEAVKILTLAAQMNAGESGSALAFSDVQPTEWFAPFIALASQREIVSGYGNGTFGPEKPITRAEAAKIVAQVMRQNPLINGYVLPTNQ